MNTEETASSPPPNAQALQASEERFRIAAEHASDLIYEWDIASHRLQWFGNVDEKLGYEPGEFPRTLQAWEEVVHPEDRPRVLTAVERHLKTRAPFFEEYRVLRKDGEVLYWTDSGAAIWTNGDETPAKWVGAVTDITDRKQAEEEREELLAREKAAHAEAEAAQWRFAFLAEASTLLTSSLDYSTTLERVARLAVPYLADWCVIDMPDDDGAIRRLAVAHVDPAKVELAKKVERRYPTHPDSPFGPARVLKTGVSEIYPAIPDSIIVAIAHDEDHLTILRELGFKSAMSVPLVARGRALGVLTFISAESGRHYNSTDLTLAEDLAARAALAVDNARLYRDARDAVRAREQFISVASHELRTPITVIQGYTQLLLRVLERSAANFPSLGPTPGHPEGFGPPQMTGYLKSIERSTVRLNKLIEELLDLSRLQNRGMTIAKEKMNLAELLLTVVESVRIREQNAPGASPMIWKVQLPETGVWGAWDKSRIEQVLVNLLDNALKYSPSGAEIAVGLEIDGENAHAWIADQGIGIPPEERSKIFQPFFRATNVASGGRTLPGLGLGLSICREIMDLHEGRIWVESAGPKKGSVFHMSLPGVVNEPAPSARESRSV